MDFGFGVLLAAGTDAAVLPWDFVGAVLLILLGLLLTDFVMGVLPVMGFFSAGLAAGGRAFFGALTTAFFAGADLGGAAFFFAGTGLAFDGAADALAFAGFGGGEAFFTGFFTAGLGAGFFVFTAALAIIFFAISGSLHLCDMTS